MIISESKTGSRNRTFELCPEGWHEVILGDIIDLGILQTRYGAKRHLRFVWFTETKDSEGQPYRLFQQFPVSSHPESNLMKNIAAILDYAPHVPFDTEELIGHHARVRVRHVRSTSGKVYANIVMTLQSESNVAEIPANYVRQCDREERA